MLQVTESRRNVGTRVMKVEGFSQKELSELNSMEYREMKDAVLTALDNRNGGIGSVWSAGYGVYTVWIMNNCVFLEVGTNCD